MASLKEVRNRINSINSTQQITKAMKMVAAAKLRRAQDNIIQLRPYAQRLNTILDLVTNEEGVDNSNNAYKAERPIEKVLIVAISSDKGLCGAFNTNVFKAVNALIAEKYTTHVAQKNVEILAIGKRSNEYFTKRDYTVISDFATIFQNLSFEEVRKAAEFTMDGFLAKKYDVVEIVYNEFKNVATQIVQTQQYLPMLEDNDIVKKADYLPTDYIFEPSKQELAEILIPKLLKVQFFKAVLESNASEHGARMTAMDKATENAGELLKSLKLTYNRTRQAAITKEILEIVGGAEALSK